MGVPCTSILYPMCRAPGCKACAITRCGSTQILVPRVSPVLLCNAALHAQAHSMRAARLAEMPVDSLLPSQSFLNGFTPSPTATGFFTAHGGRWQAGKGAEGALNGGPLLLHMKICTASEGLQ